MQRIYFLAAFLLLSTGFFSCQKGGKSDYIPGTAAQALVGKWALQTDHSVQYVNGVKQVDTIYNTAQNSYVNTEFKADGTYITTGSYYNSLNQGGFSTGAVVTNFTASGTYVYTRSGFSVTGNVGGFSNSSSFYSVTAGTIPVVTPVSNSVQINELTGTKLTLHTEIVYTSTVNNTSQTYKLVNDLAYDK
jgi:hypothetical protein